VEFRGFLSVDGLLGRRTLGAGGPRVSSSGSGPGETIPVDGEVLVGRATVNQATVTGEAMPIEVEPGSHVFAATQATLGSLRIRATRIGAKTTFGKVIRLVEEAETNRADIQRLAGTDVAIEAAQVALMREDWSLVPELLMMARRTMRTVKINIGFTAVYNLIGLVLAALGFLPPTLASSATRRDYCARM
jgi:cation transport ATPase